MEWLGLLKVIGIIVGILAGTAGIAGLWLGIDNRNARERERLEREKDRENVRSSVRILIKSELEHNQAALQAYWQDTVMKLPVGTSLEQQFQQRRALIDMPLPTWQHRTWDSLTPELALALEPDVQRDIRTLYARLDSLSERVERIKSSMPIHLASDYDDYCAHIPLKQRAIVNTSFYERMQKFVRDTQQLWSECEDLHRQLNFGTVLSRCA